MPPKSQIIWDYSIPNAQIKFGAEHSKFCASQIIYGIPKLGFPLTFEIFPIIYQIISICVTFNQFILQSWTFPTCPLLPTINTFCTQTVIFFITMKIIYFYKMLPNGFFSLPNFLFLLLSFWITEISSISLIYLLIMQELQTCFKINNLSLFTLPFKSQWKF